MKSIKINQSNRAAAVPSRWLSLADASAMLASLEGDPRFIALVETAIVERWRRWAPGRSDLEAALLAGEFVAIASRNLALAIVKERVRGEGVTGRMATALAERLAGRIEAVAREAIEGRDNASVNCPLTMFKETRSYESS